MPWSLAELARHTTPSFLKLVIDGRQQPTSLLAGSARDSPTTRPDLNHTCSASHQAPIHRKPQLTLAKAPCSASVDRTPVSSHRITPQHIISHHVIHQAAAWLAQKALQRPTSMQQKGCGTCCGTCLPPSTTSCGCGALATGTRTGRAWTGRGCGARISCTREQAALGPDMTSVLTAHTQPSPLPCITPFRSEEVLHR